MSNKTKTYKLQTNFPSLIKLLKCHVHPICKVEKEKEGKE